jgi:competence protein ComEC
MKRIAGLVLLSVALQGADGKLNIFHIDVEGGAATLIVTPEGDSLLVDTGNPRPD